VFQVAVHFPRHVDRDELARAGALGLVEAARRFDESRGSVRPPRQRIQSILDAVRAADWAPCSVRTLPSSRRPSSGRHRARSVLNSVDMAEALA
jgi:RNA polymerase sigma factor for flagellar operon FliA